MAAMVQSFPSQAPTMTMLQSRSSSSDAYQNTPRNQQRSSHITHNMYNGSTSGMVTSSYRGHTTVSPIPPYAFTATPSVNAPGRPNPLQQNPPPSHPRLEHRTSSAPIVPQLQQPATSTISARPPVLSLPFQYNGQGISETSPSPHNSKPLNQRPLSSLDLNPPALTATSNNNPPKPSPDRYRRVQRNSETFGGQPNVQNVPAGVGMVNGGGLYMNPTQASSSPTLSPYPTYRAAQSSVASNATNFPPIPSRTSTMDDMSLPKPQHDVANRYRRRSISSLDPGEHRTQSVATPSPAPAQPKSYAAMLAGPAPHTSHTPHTQLESRVSHTYPRPGSSHERHGSVESSSSGRSSSRPASVRSSTYGPSFSIDLCWHPSSFSEI